MPAELGIDMAEPLKCRTVVHQLQPTVWLAYGCSPLTSPSPNPSRQRAPGKPDCRRSRPAAIARPPIKFCPQVNAGIHEIPQPTCQQR